MTGIIEGSLFAFGIFLSWMSPARIFLMDTLVEEGFFWGGGREEAGGGGIVLF